MPEPETTAIPGHQASEDGEWWRGGILYQVYVRSFADGNADGVGDLSGLASRLDYLASLGLDGLWLTPLNPSPDADWGYDVSDYRAVHPALGTLEDLDALIERARRRSIKIVADLVPNHTSDRHPWFKAARTSRQDPRRSWYVWAPSSPGGGPPNNWRSVAGGSAWSRDPSSGEWYLHSFLPEQADLNWWSPEVRSEFESILRCWFDRGIAGVRIDVAHGLVKDAALRDNPPLVRDGRFHTVLEDEPQVYNFCQPEVHAIYRAWHRIARSTTEARLLLGETFVDDLGTMASFLGSGRDELDLALNIPFFLAPFEPEALADVVQSTLEVLPNGASALWCLSSHDRPRFPTRIAGNNPALVPLGLVLLLCLPGTTLLYYGDEIGLSDQEVPAAKRRDRMGWPGEGVQASRDPCRTPMRWGPGANAGFTPDHVEPWLPVGAPEAPTVAEQDGRPGSPLELVRALARIRRRHRRALASGDHFRTLAAGPDRWVFEPGPGLAVALNFSGAELEVADVDGRVALSTASRLGARRPLVLGPWEGVVVEVERDGR